MQYWAYRGNERDALRNGSFIRTAQPLTKNDKAKFAQYMNGDFVGFLEAVDLEQFAPVDLKMAQSLIPKVCGGKGGYYA